MFSMRRHANFIKRFKSVTCLFTASVLFPMQASAAVSDYDALIIEARKIGKHVMVAGIEAQNHTSIHLHETLGFVTTGQMPQVGTKFGRWLDLTFMQLQLDERSEPDALP